MNAPYTGIAMLMLAGCAYALPPVLGIGRNAPDGIVLQWSDPDEQWRLQQSPDLARWFYPGIDLLTRSESHSFSYHDDSFSGKMYYRLKKTGQRRIYVVGDSTSHYSGWPLRLQTLTGIPAFSQAIGGTKSPSMVQRAAGVELMTSMVAGQAYPAGPIRLRWHRHMAERTQDPWSETYRSQWPSLVKTVAEPTAIEVYQDGGFIGNASRMLKKFSTDHANAPKTIHCPGHGLTNGDRVAFISSDPAWPADLSAADNALEWNFTSPLLPANLIERRVYFVANESADFFEVREMQGDANTLDIGGDSTGEQFVECGWELDFTHAGGPLDITWRTRTPYDDWIWLLNVSANDIPSFDAMSVTIPNTESLLDRLLEPNPRFAIICPLSGSYVNRNPGSFNWNNYYYTYMPWVKTNHPDRHIDTMALLSAHRTAKERSFLSNPEIPQLLWIKGSPQNESSWQASLEPFEGATQHWVGPGFVPLQFRANFEDDIHLGNAGNQVLAEAIADFIETKGW